MTKIKQLSNKEIEEKSIKYIMKRYPKAKRVNGVGYDLKIGRRIVEVKGTSKKNYTQRIFFSGQKEHDVYNNCENFWLFRVFNVGTSKIEIKEIPKKDLIVKPDPRWRVSIRKRV